MIIMKLVCFLSILHIFYHCSCTSFKPAESHDVLVGISSSDLWTNQTSIQ